jgi:hypothetical protein
MLTESFIDILVAVESIFFFRIRVVEDMTLGPSWPIFLTPLLEDIIKQRVTLIPALP